VNTKLGPGLRRGTTMRISACILVAALAASAFANAYAARGYPSFVTLPNLPIDKNAVDTDSKAESEFILRDKTELHRGKVWLGYLNYQKAWGGDRRDALNGIVRELEKGGWEVMMRDEPRNPPLATLKLTTDDNKVMWASVEVFDKARVLVLEQRSEEEKK
jgi:hypothetical protein